jgi:serine-type D-Ala-D-Ala carboxypeptidase/endopeptidase
LRKVVSRSGVGAVLKKALFPLLLACCTVSAEPALPDGYRQAFEQRIVSGGFQNIAVGWINGTDRGTWYFGQAKAGGAFEIGAVTEIFTGLLLGQAIYEGKVRLQTPVHSLLPEDFSFADPAVGAMTLEMLATHRSGLPALPPNLMPRSSDDPYADYSERDLSAFLANFRGVATSADYAYSPLDDGLLGYLLGRSYATNYTKALDTKVLAPLGLTHTGSDDGASLVNASSRGQPVAHWHFAALVGSAGLRSTLDDLMLLLRASLRPEDSPLRVALLLAREPRAQIQTQETGLGWNIHQTQSGEQTWPLVWRASSTAGFSSFVGFRTDRQQALVLLGDSDSDLSALGMALLEGSPAPPDAGPPAPATPIAQLADFPGLYKVHSGIEITVRLNNGQLSAQLSGQPAALLRDEGQEMFDATTRDFGISFQREAGKVINLVLTHDGASFLAQRLSDHAPHVARAPMTIPAGALEDFAGDYQVDENTLARFTVGATGLSWQMSGRAAAALLALAKDHFASADDACDVTFQRDGTGKVVTARLELAGVTRDAARVHWKAP